jgi:hypothetical protein
MAEKMVGQKKSVEDAVRVSVATAVGRGSLLRVAEEASRIAKAFGGSPEEIYEDLVEAGIEARINMEFGSSTSSCTARRHFGSTRSV